MMSGRGKNATDAGRAAPQQGFDCDRYLKGIVLNFRPDLGSR